MILIPHQDFNPIFLISNFQIRWVLTSHQIINCPSELRKIQRPFQNTFLSQNALSMWLDHWPSVSYKELQRVTHTNSFRRGVNPCTSMTIDIVKLFAILTKLCHLEFVAYGQNRKSKAIGTTDCKQASLVFCWCLLRIALSPIASVLLVEPPEAIE